MTREYRCEDCGEVNIFSDGEIATARMLATEDLGTSINYEQFLLCTTEIDVGQTAKGEPVVDTCDGVCRAEGTVWIVYSYEKHTGALIDMEVLSTRPRWEMGQDLLENMMQICRIACVDGGDSREIGRGEGAGPVLEGDR